MRGSFDTGHARSAPRHDQAVHPVFAHYSWSVRRMSCGIRQRPDLPRERNCGRCPRRYKVSSRRPGEPESLPSRAELRYPPGGVLPAHRPGHRAARSRPPRDPLEGARLAARARLARRRHLGAGQGLPGRPAALGTQRRRAARAAPGPGWASPSWSAPCCGSARSCSPPSSPRAAPPSEPAAGAACCSPRACLFPGRGPGRDGRALHRRAIVGHRRGVRRRRAGRAPQRRPGRHHRRGPVGRRPAGQHATPRVRPTARTAGAPAPTR